MRIIQWLHRYRWVRRVLQPLQFTHCSIVGCERGAVWYVEVNDLKLTLCDQHGQEIERDVLQERRKSIDPV